MKRLLPLMVLAAAAILGGAGIPSAAQAPPAAAPAPAAPGPNQRFYAIQQKLDQGGSFYLYCDLKDQLKQFMTMLRPFLIKPGMPSQALGVHAMADRVLDRLGLYGIHDLGMSSISEGEFNRTKCYVSAPEGRQRGILAMLGGAPHPLALLDRASSTTLIAAMGDLDLPAVWALVRQIAMDIGGINGTMAIDKGVIQIKQQSGLDLEAIVNSLGGEFAVFLDQDPASKLVLPMGPANPLTFDAPRLALLVRVKDATLYDSVKSVLQSRQTPLKPETTAGKLKMVLFDLPPNPVWAVSPVLACDGEYLYLSSHVEMVRQFSAGPTLNSLRSNADYQKLTAGLPTEGNAATYVSPRLGALVQDILSQIQAVNPLFQNGAGELFVDLVQKQAGAASVRVNEANGVLSITRSKGGGLLYMGGMLAVPAGALAAIASKQFDTRRAQAKQNAVKTQIATLGTALATFEVDMGRYPTTAEGLDALVTPIQSPNWKGPYIKNKIPNDPWGNPYIYECPGRSNAKGYDLISTGPDGQRDTDDDVTNSSPNK